MNLIKKRILSLILAVKKNSDGTFSFWQGEDTIAVYAAGNFADMTNNASHSGADNRWNLAFKDGLFYCERAKRAWQSVPSKFSQH